MVKVEEGGLELVPAPDVAQQPDKLLEAQKLLGNLQIHPESWEQHWGPNEKESAVRLNRSNPAEFFLDISEFAAGSNSAQKCSPQQMATVFREAWMNGIVLDYETHRERQQKNKMPHERKLGEDTMLPDVMRRIFRLAIGKYYWAYEGQNYTMWQPFREEIARRSKGAETPEAYLSSLRPAYSLINKALATQPYTSRENSKKSFWNEYNENSSHLTIHGRALANSYEQTHEKKPCFKDTSSYIRDLLNIVNLHEGVEDLEWGFHQQEQSRKRIFGYNRNTSPKWIEDGKKRQQIRKLKAKFEEIKNIGAGNQHWQLAIALPTWQRLDEKGERYEYQLGPSSDDFIETTLSLMEEQIDYIKRNGARMWQSVLVEEKEELRKSWEKRLRPTCENIFLLNHEIEGLQKSNTRLEKDITYFSKELKILQEILAETRKELGGKEVGWFGGKGFLDGIKKIFENLTGKINAHIKAIKRIEPEDAKKEKLSPVIEPQALLDDNNQYIEVKEKLERELTDKQRQKTDLEKSKPGLKQKLQETLGEIKNVKNIAEDCLTYARQIINTNPGKKEINGLLLPTLREKLSKAQRTSP